MSSARLVVRVSALPLCLALLLVPIVAHGCAASGCICATVEWAARLAADGWTRSHSIALPGEARQATLYTDSDGNQQLVVDVYNVILQGKIRVARDGERYDAVFSYQVHADTTGPINGPSVVMSATYAATDSEMSFYCYEIQAGKGDIARNIANDLLLSVLKMAPELMR